MPLALAALAGAVSTAPAAAQSSAAASDRAQDTAWHNRQGIALSALDQAEGWRPVARGLMWRRTAGDGSGAHPSVADRVRIHYAGRFIDGEEFDSSYARGAPATFPLARLIPAWQLAVPLMGVGDTIEIAVPADLAYGPNGKGPIPGNATLFFTIELLGIDGRE